MPQGLPREYDKGGGDENPRPDAEGSEMSAFRELTRKLMLVSKEEIKAREKRHKERKAR